MAVLMPLQRLAREKSAYEAVAVAAARASTLPTLAMASSIFSGSAVAKVMRKACRSGVIMPTRLGEQGNSQILACTTFYHNL